MVDVPDVDVAGSGASPELVAAVAVAAAAAALGDVAETVDVWTTAMAKSSLDAGGGPSTSMRVHFQSEDDRTHKSSKAP